MNCVHEGSPIEPYPESGTLLRNPMLTQIAPRDLTISVGLPIRSDVGLFVFADLDEICA